MDTYLAFARMDAVRGLLEVRHGNGAAKHLYEKKYNITEFAIIYSSAVKRLFKEGLIKKEEPAGKSIQYRLTDKGYDFAKLLLSYVSLENKTRTIDKMRLKIMYSQYY